MTDSEALVQAVCQSPDDDTLRLILADAIEEAGDPARAAFIRTQIELAHTPAWEPFAAQCRHRDTNISTGEPFKRYLSPVDGWNVEWPLLPFRRGLGWGVNVRSLVVWNSIAERFLAQEPVGELRIYASATFKDWERFFSSPSLHHLRQLHFDGLATPIEPIRLLRTIGHVHAIEDLHFQRADSLAMSFILDDLLSTPAGRSLRGLHFRNIGHESVDDLLDSLAPALLDRLTLSNAVGSAATIRRLCDLPTLQTVRHLDLSLTPLGDEGSAEMADKIPGMSLESLILAGVGLSGRGMEALAAAEQLAGLRLLDLSSNPLTPRALRLLSRSVPLGGLRSINLSRCQVGDKGVRHVCRARFWKNAVEVVLTENPISRAGVHHLIDAPVPRNLTALVLTGSSLTTSAKAELVKKYGESVVFAG